MPNGSPSKSITLSLSFFVFFLRENKTKDKSHLPGIAPSVLIFFSYPKPEHSRIKHLFKQEKAEYIVKIFELYNFKII